ncbi:hypothetical protein PAE9249_02663 [Paenibacillus sp. CECT 9249]|uniref:SEC-C metal-binding domain-containing protein n=1 Tax=Paenibacillus sp. CECT 9249 TaxID=2845385 RepID=UPI001E363F36|nr:SEC-C metal-binding domain-containing protein [Paenibacillus sp. CECT 9249]CAH0120150.1 hypothetical protein PAE9249_02663 [Paenibacillus sp. CECT 9249]
MIDYNSLYEQKNIQHAIIGDIMTRLPEALRSLTKARLAALASEYGAAGRSKMNKEDLVDALVQYITAPDLLESFLYIASPKEWKLFESLVNGPIQNNTIPYGDYCHFLDRGLVFSYFTDHKFYLVMPDEVKAAYAALNTETFAKSRERRQLVYQYILAASHLYGAIQPDKLIDIFNEQNSEHLTRQELDRYLDEFLAREQVFYYENGHIVEMSVEEKGDLETFLHNREGKPFYIPPKSEFLKYADDQYFEMTPQLTALKKYVSEHLCKDQQMVEYLIDDVQLACSMEAPLQDIIYEFERRDIIFDTMKQAEKVVSLITDIHNHTRLWRNAGHTAMELREISVPSGQRPTKAPFQVLVNGQIASKKIGRNEPCPCGSGLKYKKCCGK